MTATVIVKFGDVIIKRLACKSFRNACIVAQRERESLARWWGPRDYAVWIEH